jgi:hypothetical protein
VYFAWQIGPSVEVNIGLPYYAGRKKVGKGEIDYKELREYWDKRVFAKFGEKMLDEIMAKSNLQPSTSGISLGDT